jgi:hypothetical protein
MMIASHTLGESERTGYLPQVLESNGAALRRRGKNVMVLTYPKLESISDARITTSPSSCRQSFGEASSRTSSNSTPPGPTLANPSCLARRHRMH